MPVTADVPSHCEDKKLVYVEGNRLRDVDGVPSDELMGVFYFY